MAKKTKPAQAAVPYVRQAFEDAYVQKQLRNAASRLGEAYARISKRKMDAASDKKLYRSLRGAAVSIRKAAGAIEEPPPKPKRRGRKAFLVAVALAGIVVIAKRTSSGDSEVPMQTHSTASNGGEPTGGDSTPRQTPAQTSA
jgi:ferric-dicitrate binding protein FerR (iron transport regulator)